VSSLSELDVRSLKTLYDSKLLAYPSSPNPASAFSIDAFVQRVQALIADDRALIERLIRFAQAHDLLKKNAERAQKLAHESGGALETYQKQVRAMEERNMALSSRQIALYAEYLYFAVLFLTPGVGRTNCSISRTLLTGSPQKSRTSKHKQPNKQQLVVSSQMPTMSCRPKRSRLPKKQRSHLRSSRNNWTKLGSS
jgi:hypothetical protein